MELIVFDLDGTLLNRHSEISAYTRDTLAALADRDIAYTVATGRTLHASRDLLHGHGFRLPQVFKNGVMIWNPADDAYSHQNFLTQHEIQHVLEAVLAQDVTPFIFTLEPGNRHAVYHPPLRHSVEEKLASEFSSRSGVDVLPASQMPADAEITNISALGVPASIDAIETLIEAEPGLVAYAGIAHEGAALRWIDIHHSNASKGGAVDLLREQLGASRVLCFGDSDNDLSMFGRADEAYAPDNAKDAVKQAATAVIGHHDEDGIARFLRERFGLESRVA
ncbi:MAG: HAD-IIB family hydrolase [Halieaceae bacterium]|jgi:Cof subfamily protein (haloacid dehalogenase superfamily)|nr:HAD-IIB family hydrolase [Halieaceae bacterium]